MMRSKIITFCILATLLSSNFCANSADTGSNSGRDEKRHQIYSGQHTADKKTIDYFEKTFVVKQKIPIGKIILQFESKEGNRIRGIKFTEGDKTTSAEKGAYLITSKALIFCLENGKRIESDPKSGNLYVMEFKEVFLEFPLKPASQTP